MSLKKILPGAISLVMALSAIAYAQETQTAPPPDGQKQTEGLHRGWGRGHKPGRFHGGMRLMEQLNLTAEQRQQQQAIMQRHLEATRPLREELMALRDKRVAGTFTAEDEARLKTLRQQLHESMKSLHSELESILTIEQRTKLDEIKKERKSRSEEWHKRRQESQTNRS